MKIKALIVIPFILGLLFSFANTLTAQGDAWNQKGDFGGTARYEAVGLSINGKGYIGTGRIPGFPAFLTDFWEYDPSTEVWTQKADFIGACSNAVSFVIGDKGYVGTGRIFGFSASQFFYEYDAALNTWTQKANVPRAASNAVGFSIGNKGYVGALDSSQGDFWEYDPTADAWTRKADFGGVPREGVIGFNLNDQGYIGLGRNPGGSGTYYSDIWKYDPLSDTWEEKKPFPGSVSSTEQVSIDVNARGYVLLFEYLTSLQTFWEYNPTLDQWIQRSTTGLIPRSSPAGFSLNGKGYIGTGSSGTGRKDVWEYDPASPATTPVITNFIPTSGPIGTTVTITGTNFDPIASNNIVKFNGINALTPAFATTTSLIVIVPVGASTGPVSVTTTAGTGSSTTNYTVTSSCIPLSERNALIALYNTTGGASWNNSTNWLNSDESTWFGITVEGCHVSSIDMPFNNLIGTIPPEIINLTELKHLILHDNQLTGNIPSFLGGLSNLETLTIQWNNFTGSIPPELGNLSQIKTFDICCNALTGSVPKQLGNLLNAEIFKIQLNQLSGSVPLELGSLTNLKWFDIGFNDLSGTVADYPSIEQVYISGNNFSQIPVFSSLAIFELHVEENYLTFEDLEPNILKSGFAYSPQAKLAGGTFSVSVGSTLAIPFTTGGTQNVYQWYKDGSPIVGATNQQYAKANAQLTDAGSYTVQVTNTLVTGLTLISDPFIVTITACPSPPLVTANSGCTGSAINLSASGGTAGQYRWYTVATGGTHDASQTNSTFATPALTATTSYWVAINDGTCESSRTEVIATVLPLPTAPVIQSVNPVCAGSDITLTATGGTDGEYRWYDGAAIISGEVNNTLVVTNLTFAKPFSAAITDGTCESNKTSVIAPIKSCTAPSVESTVATAFVNGIVSINLQTLISDPEDDLDPASLQIIEQPQSGAAATLEGFNLNIDYSGIAFSGTDRVTVGVCDLTNLCTEQAVTIELGGEIKIYNAVSPNGDGKNEIFFIQYIDLLPETQRNSVTIYNRWGDEVFQTKNYNNTSNVFKGQSNTGDKLPSGTYFYKIIFASGKSRTGFLELKH